MNRFSQSLETDSLEYAELRKLPIVANLRLCPSRSKKHEPQHFECAKCKSDLKFQGNFAVHSFRAMLANQFENAGVEENFAARIIGHKVEPMTYGLYSGKID